ncbi:MAG: hypothetical protein CMG04_05240 [Candidatus Marinimicrobia bacterium]|nr:hypothetical protein [Candidatus Neomarinimicrobiota bacterium]
MGKYLVSKRNLIKKVLFFILSSVYALQDSSLFWYDMQNVFDPIPKTTVIIDDILKTKQLDLLDSLNQKNQKIKVGFRLQLFETISKDIADEERLNFQKVLNDTVYVVFEAPLYRLQVGDFFTRKEAEKKRRNLVKNGYKNIWIVKSRIRNRTLF